MNAVTGAGELRVSNGTVVLTGANSVTTNTVTGSNSVLQVGNGGATGAIGNVSANSGGTVAFNRSVASNYVYTGVINNTTGSGNVNVLDNSQVTFTGANTYTGTASVQSGAILRIGNAGTSGSITSNVNLVAGSSALTFARTNAYSYTNNITGSGAVNVTSAGLITLSGSGNTYLGGTNILSGTVKLGANNALPIAGAVALGGSGTTGILDLNGFNQQLAGISINGAAVANSQTITNTGGNDSTLTFIGNGTFAGKITDSTKKVALVVNGASSALSLTNGTNAYTGGTTINDGILTFSNNALGSTGASTITFGGGTLQYASGNTQDISGRVIAIANLVAAKVDTNGNNVTFASGLTGQGGLTKSGNGTLTLSGSNSFTGGTIVNAGTISLGASDALANTGAVTVNASGAVFDVNIRTDTVGVVTLVDGSITGTSGVLSGSSYAVQNGSISAILGGSGALTKSTSGTVTLSGANTYSGGTNLQTGSLNINNASAIGSGALTITGGVFDNTSAGAFTLSTNNAQNWNADAVFTGTQNLNMGFGGVTMNTSRQVTVTGGTLIVNGNIAGSTFGLTKAGVGTLVLGGANGYDGGTTVNAGALNVSSIGNLAFRSNLTIGASGTSAFANSDQTLGAVTNANTAASSLNFTALTGTTDFTSLTGAGRTNIVNNATIGTFDTGTLTVGAVGTFTTVTSGTLNLNGATSSIGTLNGGAIDLATTALTINDGNSSGIIAGANGSLIKATGGTLTLSGANTYGGGTAINVGTLNFTNGALGSGDITFGGGTLQFATGNTQDIGSRIKNSGSAVTLDTNGNATTTFAGSLASSNTGGLTKTGAGTLILAGANGYSGTTTVTTGTLQVGNGTTGSIASNSASVGSGATLNINTAVATNTTLNDADGLNGSGSVTITKGTLNVTGATNSFSGTIGIAGVLNVTGGLGSVGAVVVNNGGVLRGNGTLGDLAAQQVTVASGGTLTANAGGGSALSLSNVVFQGTTTNSGFINVADVTSGVTAAILKTAGTVNSLVTAGTGSVKITVGGTNIFVNGSSYKLIEYTGSITNADFALNATTAGLGARQTPTLDFGTTGQIRMLITGDSPVWTGITSGEWSANAIAGSKNWKLLVAGTPTDFLTTDQVLFDDTATGTTTVNITDGTAGPSNVLPSSVTFNNSSLNYILNSSNGSGIAGTTGLTKNGTGSVNINTANSYTGGTTINAGTIIAGSATALGSSTGTLVMTGGTLDLNNNNLGVGILSGAAGVITNNATGTANLTVNSTGSTVETFAGTLVDGGSGKILGLTTTGTGTLTLTSGSNAYTGSTTLNDGTLNFVSGALGTTGNISFGGGTLQYATGNIQDIGSRIKSSGSAIMLDTNGNASTAFAGGIDGTNTAGLTKLGGGNLILAGANSYTGLTTVSAGSAQVGDGSNTGNLTGGGGASLAGGTSLIFNTSSATASSLASLTGAGDLTMTLGTLNVTGNNTGYTGTTTIGGGTLGFANNSLGTTGSITFTGTSGALKFSSTNTQDVSNRIAISGGATGIIDTNDNNVTFAAALANSGTAAFTKNGLGILILSAANNSYTGATTINGGTLQIGTGGAAAMGSNSVILGGGTLDYNTTTASASTTISGTGNVTVRTGTLSITGTGYTGATRINGGTLKFTAASLDSSTITFGGGVLQYDTSNTQDVSSQIQPITTGVTAIINTNGNNVSYATGLTGAGAFTKQGLGTLTLAGTSTYSGATTIASGGGTLQIGTAGSGSLTGGTAAVTVGTTLRFSGGSGSTLTGLSGTGALVLTSGTLEVSGTNVFSGGTTISAGTLTFGSSSLGTTGAINFTGTTGTLKYASANTQDVSSRITIGATSTAIIDTNGNSPVVFGSAVGGSSTGGFTKNGLGTLTLNAASNYTGLTAVQGGELKFGITNAVKSGNAITVNDQLGGTTLLNLNGFNATVGSLTLGGAGATATSVNNVSTGAGTLNLTGNLTYDATNNPLGSTISGKLDLGSATRTFAVADSSSTTSELTVSAVISNASGTAGLTKTGLGTLVLSAANTYNGATTISGGTLQLGSGTTTGALNTASAISVGSGATFAVNQTDAVTQGTDFGAISGAGNFAQTGSGSMTLNGTSSYSGTTNVSNGQLHFAASQTSTSSINVAESSGTLGSYNAGSNSFTGQNAAVLSAASGVTLGSASSTVTIGSVGGDVGILAPGASLGASNGSLTIGKDLVVNSGMLDLGITSPTVATLVTFTNGVYTFGGSTYNTAGDLFNPNFGGASANAANAAAAKAIWDVAPSAAGNHDFINVAGALTLNSGSKVHVFTSGSPTYNYGQVFNLIDWSSASMTGFNLGTGFSSGGSFGDFNLATLGGGLAWDTSAFASNGILVVVPEPSRMLLLMFGLLGLFFRRRRRSNSI